MPSTFSGSARIGKAFGNQLGRMRRAIAGRDNGNIIASAHAAVRALVAEKSFGRYGAPCRGLFFDRHFGGVQFLVAQIVNMHMLARLNSRSRKTDHVAVAINWVARPNRTDGHFVAGGNRRERTHGELH